MPAKTNSVEKKCGVVVAATSDLHGYLEGIQQVCSGYNVDVLCIAGDIQPADIMYHCNDSACSSWFRNKFFKLVKKLKCEVVAIPGNHDFWLRSFIGGKFGTFEECKKKFFIPDNFHLLCDSAVTVKGLRIYGTPWVPYISGHWCYEAVNSRLERDWFSQIPEGIDILVTHSPPICPNSNIDVSLERDPKSIRHFGSEQLTKAIQRASPSVVFCGHIHSGDHRHLGIDCGDKIAHCYNVSRVNERYCIGYGLTVLEVCEKTIREVRCGRAINSLA